MKQWFFPSKQFACTDLRRLSPLQPSEEITAVIKISSVRTVFSL